MAKEFSKAFYKSKAWLSCRAGFIQSVYGLCNRCLEEGKTIPGFIVHHKIYINANNINNYDIILNWDNLEYLCHEHHNKEHFGKHKEVIREGLIFDSNGDIIERTDTL